MTADFPLDDQSFMREAIRVAARVSKPTWPNPPVGALVVDDRGMVVGRGTHHGPGTPHAEVVALDEAGTRAKGATLYCTLEPCNHQGRTPPCAPRVAASGIRRLVVGVLDPNPSVKGGGLEVVRQAGVDVTLGVAGRDALELIWPFVASRAFARPYVLLKTAQSLDARFGLPASPGVVGSVPLTGIEARRDVHRMRRWADLVLVGSRTILADRPRLDGRHVRESDECPTADPMPGYVNTDLSLDAEWTRKYVACCGRRRASAARVRAVEDAGGTVVVCDENERGIVPASLLEGLWTLGLRSIFLEGGPSLAASFLAEGLIDRWVMFVAPVVLGAGPSWPTSVDNGAKVDAPVHLHPAETTRIGDDTKLVFDRVSFDDTLRALTTAQGV